MNTVCKDFSYRGEHYSIVFDGKFYMTVNHKFIGDDGRLVRTLNYSDGLHPGSTIEECITHTKEDLDIQYLMSNGMSKAEAFSKVTKIPLAMAEQWFKECNNEIAS